MIELERNSRSNNLSLKKDGKDIKLVVPRSKMPFGFKVNNYGANDQINLMISLSDNPAFADEYRTLEREIIQELSNRYEDLFNTKMSVDEIYNVFNSNISDSDTLRIKYTEDSRLYDSNRVPSTMTIIDGCCANYTVTCNFYISGIYFMNKKIGLVLKAHHVKIFEPENQGFMFLDRDD